MPHQCVTCGSLYEEGAPAVLDGCACGGKVFFFVKKERMNGTESPFILTASDRQEIAKDVQDIIGDDANNNPIILDFESINVAKPGTYEIDLVNLFKKDTPVIYRIEEGKYVIDFKSTLDRLQPALKQPEGKEKKKNNIKKGQKKI